MRAQHASDNALALEIVVRAVRHDIAGCILTLHLVRRIKLLVGSVTFELVVEAHCILDLSYVLKVHRIRNLNCAHAVRVAPRLEVAVERAASPIRVVPADLALVLSSEAVELVEPERNRLSVEAKRKVQRVVDRLVHVSPSTNSSR